MMEDMSPEQVVSAVCKFTKHRLPMREDPTFGNKFLSFPSDLKGKSRVHHQMAVAELVSQYLQEPSVF